MKLIFSLLIFGAFIVVFLWQSFRLSSRALSGIRAARASREWSPAQGKVVIVNALMESDKIKRRYQTYFRPWVQCSYNVNGREYTCDHYCFNDHLDHYPNKAKALKRISAYQVGQTVTVYYNPADPAQSVLEQGNAGPSWKMLASGAVYFLLALPTMWMCYAAIVNN